ncbi:hypothetical protein DPEC_G00246890 [Dallia pectoralis]|uniref:Uncharacterized protein n=1 Tax=Dallia pectoralis TaxID=75939 RepID=A0ACC2FWE1_DALPE|nr:hypothetical protein DPEC_G00246890 [Dallia pectoralis]
MVVALLKTPLPAPSLPEWSVSRGAEWSPSGPPKFFFSPGAVREPEGSGRAAVKPLLLLPLPGPSIPGEKTGRGRGQATVTPAVFSVHKRGQKSSTKKERR